MGKIYLLDCTLRDGGYVNDWRFGHDNIKSIAENLTDANLDFVELGFLRDEAYDINRAVWNDINAISSLSLNKSCSTKYAIMSEVFNPYPLSKLPVHTENQVVDIIRIIVWKSMLAEAFEYCKAIIKKGYKLCIQPDRVNQYTIKEFQDMLKLFTPLNPYAIYVVDSNGFLSKKDIAKYIISADEVMPAHIKLGYHGHNSLLQASGAAEEFIEMGLDRDILVDGSVFGIGRSSGNLNIEIVAKYLNENKNGNYDIRKILKVFEEYIEPIYKEKQWGYSMESFITSLNYCNPNYGTILKKEFGLKASEIDRVVSVLSDGDKVITNKSCLDNLIKNITDKGI